MAKKLPGLVTDLRRRLPELTADAAAGTTAEASAVTLIQGLSGYNVAVDTEIQELIGSDGPTAGTAPERAPRKDAMREPHLQRTASPVAA